MTAVKITTVEIRFIMLGRFWRKKASRRASCLLGQVARRWIRARIAPSNSGPRPVLTVVGLKAFQTICSQTLVAMLDQVSLFMNSRRFDGAYKSEIPEPNP